jgi:hypothetical protein
MRLHHGLLAGAAIGLGGLVATILLHGWWEPAAAAVSILGGTLFLFSFMALGIAAERPRSDWAQGRRRTPPERRRRQPARSARTSRSTTTATVADVKTAAAASPNA